MFPSNPFPQLTSSLHRSPPLDHFLFLHHHRDLLLQPPAPATYENLKETILTNNFETNFHPKTKIPAKKDRHSKIYTAQGPRDRRVRLSIGIARKFFDLQDTLGFDKASQTLDWLLNHSKSAIKDLVQSKLGCTSASNIAKCTTLTSIYMSDDDVEGSHNLDLVEEHEKNICKEKKSRSKQTAVDLAVKESRAKARARARERTNEKMRVRNEIKKSGPSIPHHYHHNGGNRIGQWSLSSVPVVLNWEIGSNMARFNQTTDSLDFGKPWEVYNNQIN